VTVAAVVTVTVIGSVAVRVTVAAVVIVAVAVRVSSGPIHVDVDFTVRRRWLASLTSAVRVASPPWPRGLE
jgi:hypothetical protein